MNYQRWAGLGIVLALFGFGNAFGFWALVGAAGLMLYIAAMDEFNFHRGDDDNKLP